MNAYLVYTNTYKAAAVLLAALVAAGPIFADESRWCRIKITSAASVNNAPCGAGDTVVFHAEDLMQRTGNLHFTLRDSMAKVCDFTQSVTVETYPSCCGNKATYASLGMCVHRGAALERR